MEGSPWWGIRPTAGRAERGGRICAR